MSSYSRIGPRQIADCGTVSIHPSNISFFISIPPIGVDLQDPCENSVSHFEVAVKGELEIGGKLEIV